MDRAVFSVRCRPASAKAGVTFDPDKPYMRTLPSAQLKARRQLLDRVVVERAPELHIVGEISGATGFDSGLSCRCVDDRPVTPDGQEHSAVHMA